RKQLIQALSAHDRDTSVTEVTDRDIFTTDPGAPLDEVFRRMNEQDCSTVPVVEDDQLVGLLTLENVGELIMVSSALQSRTPVQRTDVSEDAVRRVAGDEDAAPERAA
ncbi:MAG: CBS domain-containing protein, partial [Salinibacter sp.]